MCGPERATSDRADARVLRARIAELREKLRVALKAKRERQRELVRIIRAERIALRERLRAERKQRLEELRHAARAEREAARAEWRRRVDDVRREGQADVDRIREELRAQRAARAAVVTIERGVRAERLAVARAAHEQSDAAVRALIPRALGPLFERVARRIRGSRAESRAEAFLRYAEKHPEEAFQHVEPQAHAGVENTRSELAAATRGAGVTDYAAKRAARIERMRAKAERLQSAAVAAHDRAKATADRIPFGQPVLVGHHSQRRHERDLDRMRRSFTQSIELTKKADELSRRAGRAERGTAVSSDDPDAVAKLREKLAALNARRERMRAANAAIRAGRDVVAALGALGFRQADAQKLLERDFAGRVGFPDYALRNAAAEAARVEKRIRELETRAATPAPADVVVEGARISEAENRVRVEFPSVPPEDVRRALKAAGFRWARSVGAWQRHASTGAWYAAKEIVSRAAAERHAGTPPQES